jgi:hypothetical protein
MLLIAVGLVLIGIRILHSKPNLWLLNTNFLAAIALLYLCCFVNFDSMIAWYNVKHCREVTGEGVFLDLEYLRQLGPESIPALVWFSKRPPEVTALSSRAAAFSQQLQAELSRDLSDWRGWTYRKHVLFRSYPFYLGS